MGANIQVESKTAVIDGVAEARTAARSVRATCARARRWSSRPCAPTARPTIEDAHYIERGYENIVEKLRALGADIEKVERVPAALEQAM